VAVDPGRRELAACVYDVGRDNFVGMYWCDLINTMALAGRSDLCGMVNDLMRLRPQIFREDAVLAIEVQMEQSAKNCIVESTVRTAYYDRGVMRVRAQDIKEHFEPVRVTSGRKAKKQSTWAYMWKLMHPHEKRMFASLQAAKRDYADRVKVEASLLGVKARKIDLALIDLADTLAIAIYAAEVNFLGGSPCERRLRGNGNQSSSTAFASDDSEIDISEVEDNINIHAKRHELMTECVIDLSEE
jgi:hypothetical protein